MTKQSEPRTNLLGLVAYASLAAFEQTAAASAIAPRVEQKMVLARLAAQRFTHLGRLESTLEAGGADIARAMDAFVAPVDGFNVHTAPADWGHALVKLCVVGGLVGDFAQTVSPQLDEASRDILLGSIDDGVLASEPGRMLAEVLEEDPAQRDRLAMYARRLLGEMLSQAQRVSASQPALTELLTGRSGSGGEDLAAIGDLMAGLATRHAERLSSLGLA
ncbi:ferritin-like fold-containing protein [Luteococcus peritonei]|uniref:Ferritin-like fold-containing protein n=1 Tax=Luteococcus peritonei TaxID=88874 RepID=A0ABW4RU00_9ACTN